MSKKINIGCIKNCEKFKLMPITICNLKTSQTSLRSYLTENSDDTNICKKKVYIGFSSTFSISVRMKNMQTRQIDF